MNDYSVNYLMVDVLECTEGNVRLEQSGDAQATHDVNTLMGT